MKSALSEAPCSGQNDLQINFPKFVRYRNRTVLDPTVAASSAPAPNSLQQIPLFSLHFSHSFGILILQHNFIGNACECAFLSFLVKMQALFPHA